jgi:hypothetical protein
MAITFALIDATPNRLLYRCMQDGVLTSPPVAADTLATLPNDAGATPDLRTDALNGATSVGSIPIFNIMAVRLNGFGPIAAGAITQAQARSLCASWDTPAAPAVLINDLIGRCVTRITAVFDGTIAVPLNTATVSWSADWNVDAQGDPVCQVRSGPGGTASVAILDIQYRHSFSL